MTRPKYKALWLAEKQRADGLQHKLRYWESLLPALEERGVIVMSELRVSAARAAEDMEPSLSHWVTHLDYEALKLSVRSHSRLVADNYDDLLGFSFMTFEGVPIVITKERT